MSEYRVDRCICHEVTFAELARLRAETGADLPELVRRTGCGRGCGLCKPYLVSMMKTGRTEFSLLAPGPSAELAAEYDALVHLPIGGRAVEPQPGAP